MDEILTIHITKHFGEDSHEITMRVNDLNTLEQALGTITSSYIQGTQSEKDFWDTLLKKTPFETKEEFEKWLFTMRDYDLCVKNFSYEDYVKDTVKTAMEEAGLNKYRDLEELEADLSETKGALKDIKYLADGAI